MSCNRENVIWQSKDGTWNRGFYSFEYVGDQDSEDFDHEWDVEYDESEFFWVSTGHRTLDAAAASWTGANPGSRSEVPHTPQYAKECAEYDRMATECQQRQAAERAALRRRPVRW